MTLVGKYLIKLIQLIFSFLVKPRIDRTNLKNIVVRAGKTIKYDVNIRGEPPPTVTWFLVTREVRNIHGNFTFPFSGSLIMQQAHTIFFKTDFLRFSQNYHLVYEFFEENKNKSKVVNHSFLFFIARYL